MPSRRSASTASADAGVVSEPPEETAGSDDAPPASAEGKAAVVEWGPVRYDRIRSATLGITAVAAAVTAAFLGSVVLLAVTGIGGGGSSALDGSALAVGFLVAAAAVLSLLPVAAAVRSEWSPESGSLREAIDLSSLRPRWVLAGVGVTAGLFWLAPRDAVGALWPLASVVFVLPQLLRSEGTTLRVDPGDPAIERESHAADRTRRDDLSAVVRTRRIDLPATETTLFLLAYRGNAWYRSTPWVFVPGELGDSVESALAEALARSDGPKRATVPERVTLALLGSASLIVGLVIAVAAGEGAGGLLLALLTAPVSLLFLALAARL